MKLNIVASYIVGEKRYAIAHSIDSSNNLVNLTQKTSAAFTRAGGGTVYIAPEFLLACESRKKAQEVAQDWNHAAEMQGLLWKGEEVQP